MRAFYTDMDGTIICNEKGENLVAVAGKNGKDSSFMYVDTYRKFCSIVSRIKTIPLTTRCEQSYHNIYLSGLCSEALVENGAILVTSNNLDRENWLFESRKIISSDISDFHEIESIFYDYGFRPKWQGVEFVLDMVCDGINKDDLCSMRESLERYSNFLIHTTSKTAVCTYKKLSKGSNLLRHSTLRGYEPFVSAGDRVEDESMFHVTKYSFGLHNILHTGCKLDFCRDVISCVYGLIDRMEDGDV